MRHGNVLTVVTVRHFGLWCIRDAHLDVNGRPDRVGNTELDYGSPNAVNPYARRGRGSGNGKNGKPGKCQSLIPSCAGAGAERQAEAARTFFFPLEGAIHASEKGRG